MQAVVPLAVNTHTHKNKSKKKFTQHSAANNEIIYTYVNTKMINGKMTAVIAKLVWEILVTSLTGNTQPPHSLPLSNGHPPIRVHGQTGAERSHCSCADEEHCPQPTPSSRRRSTHSSTQTGRKQGKCAGA